MHDCDLCPCLLQVAVKIQLKLASFNWAMIADSALLSAFNVLRVLFTLFWLMLLYLHKEIVFIPTVLTLIAKILSFKVWTRIHSLHCFAILNQNAKFLAYLVKTQILLQWCGWRPRDCMYGNLQVVAKLLLHGPQFKWQTFKGCLCWGLYRCAWSNPYSQKICQRGCAPKLWQEVGTGWVRPR